MWIDFLVVWKAKQVTRIRVDYCCLCMLFLRFMFSLLWIVRLDLMTFQWLFQINFDVKHEQTYFFPLFLMPCIAHPIDGIRHVYVFSK